MSRTSSAPRTLGPAIGAGTGLAVLVPYLTVGLPHRFAMAAQASALLSLTLVGLLWGGADLAARVRAGGRSTEPDLPWSRWPRVPFGLALGLVLYCLATLQGAGMGLALGSAWTPLAGQLLSMLLLPLGAAAGLVLWPTVTWRSFAAGLAGGMGIATTIHLLHWTVENARGGDVRRLILGQSVSVIGIALAALTLCLAGSRSPPSRQRRWWRVGLATTVVFFLGSGTRGLWLAAVPALLVAAVLHRASRDPAEPLEGAGKRSEAWSTRPSVRIATLLGAAALALWGVHRWLEQPRSNLLPGTELGGHLLDGALESGFAGASESGSGEAPIVWEASPDRGRRLDRILALPPMPLAGPGTYRLRLGVRAQGTEIQGGPQVVVRWLDAEGGLLSRTPVGIGVAPVWHEVERVFASPPGAASVELAVGQRAGSRGIGMLRAARLERLGPSWLSPLIRQAAYSDRRWLSVVDLVAGGDTAAVDSSVTVRLGEIRLLLGWYRDATWPKKLLGHGLGATFVLPPEIPSAARDQVTGAQNFIHSFYVFLLFKLGVLGTALVLGALALWIGTLAASSWRRIPGVETPAPARRFLGAAAAAWVGYAVLGLSSPQIVNFRVAPLLGLWLGMAAGAASSGFRTGDALRLLHVTTVPLSLGFLRGQPPFLAARGIATELVSSPGDLLQRHAREQGDLPAHEVPMARRITPLRDVATLFRLWRLFRRRRPMIVHSHTPKGGLLGMAAAAVADVPVRVFHLRGLPHSTASGLSRWLLLTADRASCRLAHRVLAVGDSLRDLAVADGVCPPGRIRVLAGGSGNGVDARGRFAPERLDPGVVERARADWGIPEGVPVVGFVGRLIGDKGVVELAEAWRQLSNRFPDAHLLVVGPFETRDPVPAAAREQLLDDPRVHLPGFVGNVEVCYAMMDVLAFPSVREGLPNVPLEAAAMETPTVAARVTGSVDAVVDGVTGTLVPPRDATSLAEAIALYLDQPELARSHGVAARARVLESFRPERIWEELAATYEELLSRVVAPRYDPRGGEGR